MNYILINYTKTTKRQRERDIYNVRDTSKELEVIQRVGTSLLEKIHQLNLL